jgi:hypothetical protein
MPGLDGQQAETKNVSSAPKQRLLCGQIRAAVAQTNPNSMPHNQRLSPLAFRLIYGLENTAPLLGKREYPFTRRFALPPQTTPGSGCRRRIRTT